MILKPPRKGEKEWFVVKLDPGKKDGDHRVEYITFVVFEDQQGDQQEDQQGDQQEDQQGDQQEDQQEDQQHVFAVADRETTVGVCDQLGVSGLHAYFDIEKMQNVDPANIDPANDVGLEDAKRICDEFSKRFLPRYANVGSNKVGVPCFALYFSSLLLVHPFPT